MFSVSSPPSLTTMRFSHSSSMNSSLGESSKFSMSSVSIQFISCSTITFFSEESESVVQKCSVKKDGLRLAIIKKETLVQVFFYEFAKFLRTAFLTKHLRWQPQKSCFFNETDWKNQTSQNLRTYSPRFYFIHICSFSSVKKIATKVSQIRWLVNLK